MAMRMNYVARHDLTLFDLDLSGTKLLTLDLSHVNAGLKKAKVEPVVGVLGADVLWRAMRLSITRPYAPFDMNLDDPEFARQKLRSRFHASKNVDDFDLRPDSPRARTPEGPRSRRPHSLRRACLSALEECGRPGLTPRARGV